MFKKGTSHMKFTIRDDDLNFFSSPEQIQYWYDDIFEMGIPVGFSAIPFVHTTSDVYVGEGSPEGEYPIHKNSLLSNYVRSQPLIEVLQHGSTHVTNDGVYEYAQKGNLKDATHRGIIELEKAFGKKPKVFVPPHDKLGRTGADAIEATDLNIIRGYEIETRSYFPRPNELIPFLRMEMHRLLNYRDPNRPSFPYILDFGTHKEACSYRIEHSTVFKGLEYASRKNGVFIVVTHLHDFSVEKKEKLKLLIRRAQELNAEFVYPSNLFE